MQKQETKDLVLMGIGGGGCSLVAAIQQQYGEGIHVIGVDTDAMTTRYFAEKTLPAILLGGTRLAGRGTGGDAVQGNLAAQDDFDSLKQQLQGVRTVVLVTCLGGGTGSGATPEIARELRGMGIVTLTFATTPFKFEGAVRHSTAQRFLPMIEDNSDSLVTLPLEALFADSAHDEIGAACGAAQQVVAAGVTLLWRTVTKPGFIKLDAEYLRRLVSNGGSAFLGYGRGVCATRADDALQQLEQCRLLNAGEAFKHSSTLLVGILAGDDLRLSEVGGIIEQLKAKVPAGSNFEVGTVLDEEFSGQLQIVVLVFKHSVNVTDELSQDYLTEARTPELSNAIEKLTGIRRRKTQGKGSKLAAGATGRGRFRDVVATKINGQDLDIPTFVRRGIVLDR